MKIRILELVLSSSNVANFEWPVSGKVDNQVQFFDAGLELVVCSSSLECHSHNTLESDDLQFFLERFFFFFSSLFCLALSCVIEVKLDCNERFLSE